MKQELGFLVGVFSFIFGWVTVSYFRGSPLPRLSDDAIAILIALVVVARLLWRLLKVFEGVAGKMGFNSARAKRINELNKRLYPEATLFQLVVRGHHSKLADAQRKKLDEELEELIDFDSNEEPAKTRQMIRVIERLRDVSALLAAKELPLHEDRETASDWARTGQLARIVEQLEHISGLLASKQAARRDGLEPPTPKADIIS